MARDRPRRFDWHHPRVHLLGASAPPDAPRARERVAHRAPAGRAPTARARHAQAPPFKLKANGWQGTFALGSSYIALPWWCGHAMFNAASISPEEVVLTILYSIAGLGIAIVNDFKSIEGDTALGMNSLPVAFGVDTAKWICVGAIDVTQLGVAAYLYSIGELRYAAILLALILPQMFSQITFVKDPVANDVKYQAAAQPFLVFGILTTAIAIGHHHFV
jgi:chlorophyll synthase